MFLDGCLSQLSVVVSDPRKTSDNIGNFITCIYQYHHAKMSVQCRPLATPLLHNKIGFYRGINYLLIFALKHRLWVLVRIASMTRFLLVPTIYVQGKNKKDIKKIIKKLSFLQPVKFAA